jgi:predicted nucleic acid-binding protein
MRAVVCDTGPLIHLTEANAIHLLELAGEILIPPTVASEFKRNLPKEKMPDWIQTHPLAERSRSRAAGWVRGNVVDLGEAEAIALALEQHTDWLLTDDAQARQLAESLGLEVHGSIGLLLWAVASGLLESREQAHRLLNNLRRSSLWISERVAASASKAIDDLTVHT